MRRTRIAMETPDPGLASARSVAQLVGEVLSWNNIRREQEVAHYVAQVEADRLAAQELTDAAAVAARRPLLDKVGP